MGLRKNWSRPVGAVCDRAYFIDSTKSRAHGARLQVTVAIFYPSRRATMSSTTRSARVSISCCVWSWIGCSTYTASKSGLPSAAACARAGRVNSCVATGTAGMPQFSSWIVSCKLHVVHDPQSASASTTASTLLNFSSNCFGAGFVYVGLVSRSTRATA